MAFNPAKLTEKLDKLNSTQASIETVSEWVQFHRKEAARVVDVWDREFAKAPPPKRLTLLYLANDILQNTRKKVTSSPAHTPGVALASVGTPRRWNGELRKLPAACAGA